MAGVEADNGLVNPLATGTIVHVFEFEENPQGVSGKDKTGFTRPAVPT